MFGSFSDTGVVPPGHPVGNTGGEADPAIFADLSIFGDGVCVKFPNFS